MIVRRFLLWARNASASDRAEGVRALTRAYLQSPLSDDERREAETALMALTEDPSPLVRLALAEELAGSNKAPRAVIIALLRDQSHIAALLLAYSPLLRDPDLVDAAAVGDALMQRAIAQRPGLSIGVTAALAEIGQPDALVALVENHLASMTAVILRRIVKRAGSVPAVREAIIARPDTPSDVLNMLAGTVAETLGDFVKSCGWMSEQRLDRVARESSETVAIALADKADRAALIALVDDLRIQGKLTAAILLRALVFAQPALVEGALAVLSGQTLERVSAAMRDRRSLGFRAIYRKAGLPEAYYAAFIAALSGLEDVDSVNNPLSAARQSLRIIERVTQACVAEEAPEHGELLVLLRRLEAEALREEARAVADSLADEAALAILIELAPEFLLEEIPGLKAA